MKENEIKILKALGEHCDGLLSPADFINGIAQKDMRAVENLVSMGYVAEVPREHRNMEGVYYTINFYRATEKGLLRLSSWYKRLWFGMKGDVRNVLISVVTAFVTALVTIFIERMIN